nr:hypothetical protein GCM10020092_053780 [Actinoplanes digitatis]
MARARRANATPAPSTPACNGGPSPATAPSSVLAWVGHGTSETGTAHLIVPGARAEPGDDHPAEDALFNPDSLAEQIEREYRRRHHLPGNFVIVLIEACGAGRFVELTAARLLAIGGIHGILLVGVGEPYGHGVLGNARATLAAVLGQYTVNDTAIRLGDLADRLDTAISAGHVQPLRLAGCTLHRPGPTITAPLDVYAALEHALAGLPAAERAHYARKGMGADFGELAWNFVGRRQELGAVNRWLRRQDNDLLVVTGTAGTGKSALLGNLLLHDRLGRPPAPAAGRIPATPRPVAHRPAEPSDRRLPAPDRHGHPRRSRRHRRRGQPPRDPSATRQRRPGHTTRGRPRHRAPGPRATGDRARGRARRSTRPDRCGPPAGHRRRAARRPHDRRHARVHSRGP